jgi:GNAT superfamily N-acetyltransferase
MVGEHPGAGRVLAANTMPMTIEPFTRNDLPGLNELRPPDWHDITPSFEFYLSRTFCFPIKSVTSGRIVGIGAAILFQSTGWLAHIIVHPEYRGCGIGGEIVSSLLKLMQNRGCQTMSLIATDLGYPVYKRSGFLDDGEYLFYKRDQKAPAMPVNEKIIGYEPQFERSALDLDAEISGENRSAVILEKLAGSFLCILDGEVAGCYLPGLGEGLIIARRREAGLALLKVKVAGSSRVVLPAQNESAVALLAQNGFHETLRCKRMVHGARLAWKPEGLFSRIAGNLG